MNSFKKYMLTLNFSTIVHTGLSINQTKLYIVHELQKVWF